MNLDQALDNLYSKCDWLLFNSICEMGKMFTEQKQYARHAYAKSPVGNTVPAIALLLFTNAVQTLKEIPGNSTRWSTALKGSGEGQEKYGVPLVMSEALTYRCPDIQNHNPIGCLKEKQKDLVDRKPTKPTECWKMLFPHTRYKSP